MYRMVVKEFERDTKNVVERMVWLRRGWPWIWRLAILSLSWQTRWFHEGVMVGGFPWEQGRISFYGSWIFLLLAIGCSWILPPAKASVETKRLTLREGVLLGSGIFLALLSCAFTSSVPATIEWLGEVLMLGLFFAGLIRQRVELRTILFWFALGIVPHLFLGLWQFVIQMVVGTKWLGIASQNPLTPGVSVVEVAGTRLLRAYGGFPHPNIFGGWLALILPYASLLMVRARTHRRALGYACFIGFAFVCLLLTFSRSAWLAFVLNGLVVGYVVLPSLATNRRVRVWGLVGLFIVLGVMFVGLFSSFITQRLRVASHECCIAYLDKTEQRSVEERSLSFYQGGQLFLKHPLLGVGPGAMIFALEKEGIWRPSREWSGPPVPPHLLPLIALNELGLLGVFGMTLLALLAVRRSWLGHPDAYSLVALVSVLTIGSFDHYLWSLWPGRVLFLLCFFILCAPRLDEEPKNV